MNKRICIVGAGHISNTHVEILRNVNSAVLSAVVDPNLEAARHLANRWKIPDVYASLDDAISADRFECAHVLVPPDRHCSVALSLLRAGKAILVEKPLGVSSAECETMMEAASPRAILGVNQNFVYHPAFVRLQNHIDRRMSGNPRFVDVLYNVPLRQMASRQFGHWMFQAPGNILLEQAIHPLSQIVTLCGPVRDMRVLGAQPEEISPGVQFVRSFTTSFSCSELPAAMRFAVGQAFPVWQIRVVCDDGVLVADMLENRFWSGRRTRWLDAIDRFASGQRTALEIARDSAKGFIDFALSTSRIRGRSDPFFRSMSTSIRAFHEAVDAGSVPPVNGQFGRILVGTCEQLCREIVSSKPRSNPSPPPFRAARTSCKFAVIGGTGFIGTHVVSRLVAAHHTVSVLARNSANLPAVFGSEQVDLHHGDIRDVEVVTRAIEGAEAVINLAHGGGGDSWEVIRDRMVGGAECVARACLESGVERLLYIGSIACLYLGRQHASVTGSSPPDPHADRRAPYARAKAQCDNLMMRMHLDHRLPVCILRPGLVVGSGSSPFHSGLGFYNNEQHCIGWNRGHNPLPFVLVDDVAQAIETALTATGVLGRCYNLVGDVRLTAREYVEALAQAMQRPLRFHPKFPITLFLEELCKWGVKGMAGRGSPLPSLHDILSRGIKADFDCTDAKRDLDWHPVSDRKTFLDRAIALHANAQ